jgi:ABC-type nitrate/sulfonate/bicarbonate transport system substrate-binding protein
MKDFGIPYGYPPVIFADTKKVKESKQAYRNFLKATKKGFLYAKAHPEQAVEYLSPNIPQGDRNIDLLESQKYTAQYYGDEESWGTMQLQKVTEYLDWSKDKGLEEEVFHASSLIADRSV